MDNRDEIKKAVEEDREKNKQNLFVKFFQDLIDKYKKKNPKKFEKVKEVEDLNKEKSEGYQDILTEEQRKDKRFKSIKNRILFFIVLLPILFFVFQVLSLAYRNYNAAVEREKREALVNEKNWKKEIKFNGNMEDAWKISQAAKIKSTKEDIQEINHKIKTISQSIEEFGKTTLEKIDTSFEKTEQQLEEISKKNDEQYKYLEQKIEEVDSISTAKLNELKNNFLTVIKEEVEKKQVNNSELLKLPSLSEFNKKISFNSNTDNSVAQKKDSLDSGSQQNNKMDSDDIEVFREVAYNVSIADENISTLESYSDDSKKDSVEDVEFTLQTGFAKGKIINGVSAQTLQYGKSQPEPIFISLSSVTKIANGFLENMDECIIIGTVTGDFGSGRAKVRMSKLSCTLEDDTGQMFAIDNPIDGWVFGEDGSNGLKGRVVTKEGEIISKALPLGMIESLMASLAASPVYLTGGTTTGTTTLNSRDPNAAMGGAFARGMNNGSQKILGKLADQYIKILDSLNPMIDIRNGRIVTLAFKGGEKLKLKPYDPVDVDFFENLRDGEGDE